MNPQNSVITSLLSLSLSSPFSAQLSVTICHVNYRGAPKQALQLRRRSLYNPRAEALRAAVLTFEPFDSFDCNNHSRVSTSFYFRGLVLFSFFIHHLERERERKEAMTQWGRDTTVRWKLSSRGWCWSTSSCARSSPTPGCRGMDRPGRPRTSRSRFRPSTSWRRRARTSSGLARRSIIPGDF